MTDPYSFQQPPPQDESAAGSWTPHGAQPYPQVEHQRRGGLPGWAIGLIITGAVFLVALLVLGFLGLNALGRVIESERVAPRAGIEQPDGPAPNSLDEAAALAQAERDAAFIVDTTEKYMAARDAGTIAKLLPDGDRVDPDYITAYLYALTDLRSAVRFTPPSAENAEPLREYAEQAEEYESRFLAGEDLDVDVKITREDGTVFESDGKYRTRDK